MATFDYSRMQDLADRLLTKFGLTTGFIRVIAVSEDEDEPWNTGTESTTNHACVFCFDNSRNELADGTRIEATDRIALVSPKALAIEIKPTHKLVVTEEDVALEIVRVVPIKPADTVALYELQVRG